MAKFELDSTMLKKMETLNRQCLMLNSMESDIKVSYQVNHERIMICVQEHPPEQYFTSWPMFTFQCSFYNLTYVNLDEAIEKMNCYLKYTQK